MHDQFGIGVIESGGRLSLSGRGQVEAGPSDVITVNPGEVHDGMPVGDDRRSWRILYFDPALVAGRLRTSGKSDPGVSNSTTPCFAIDVRRPDQSHMTRAFTRRFGLTPGAYADARR